MRSSVMLAVFVLTACGGGGSEPSGPPSEPLYPSFDDSAYRLPSVPRDRAVMSLEDFGAVGDGVTNDLAPITSALNAAKNGEFLLIGSNKTYWMGEIDKDDNDGFFGVVDIISANGLRVDFSLSTFVVKTTKIGGHPTLFRLVNPNSVVFHFGTVTDLASVNDANGIQGVKALQLYGLGLGTSRGVEVKGKTTTALVTFQISGDNDSQYGYGHKIENVTFDLESNDTFYGFSSQGVGENVKGVIRGRNNGRIYHGYGAVRHDILIFSHSDPGPIPWSNGMVKCLDDFTDSHDNTYRIFLSGDVSRYDAAVGSGFQEIAGQRTKSNIRYYISTYGVTNFGSRFSAIDFQAWDADHNVLGTTSSVWSDIYVDGDFRNYSGQVVRVQTAPIVPGRLILGPGVQYADYMEPAFIVVR